MRGFKALGGVAAGGLLLAACGTAGSFSTVLNSVGSDQYAQLHITANASSTSQPLSQEAQTILAGLSYDEKVENAGGGAVSNCQKTCNVEIDVNWQGAAFATIRQINENIYFYLDTNTIGTIPGLNLPATTLSTLSLTVGNRWLEIPSSVTTSLLKKDHFNTKKSAKASQQAEQMEAKLMDIIAKVLTSQPTTSLSNGGYEEKGNIASLVKAALPSVHKLFPTATLPTDTSKVQGSYDFTIHVSGSTLTNMTASISAQGDTLGLQVAITHLEYAITAPAHSTPVPSDLLGALTASMNPSPYATYSSSGSSVTTTTSTGISLQ